MRRKGYVLPLTFLLLVSMAIIVGSLVYVITTQFKSQGSDLEYAKCLYYAEAGMAKAVWYLKTPPYQGGYGFRWRRNNLTESFGEGSYKLTVANGNDPLQVKITVVGYCGKSSRTLQAYYYTYPPAFNYSVFSTHVFNMSNNSRIDNANVYVDNDVNVGSNVRLNNGSIIITPGHTASNESPYYVRVDPVVPFPAPGFPALDTSYYDSQIAIAALASPGDKNYNWVVPPSTIYVNGNVNLGNFWLVLLGPSLIVATGNINVGDSAYLSSNVTLIAGGTLTLYDGASVQDDSILYARQQMTIQSVNNQNHVSFICPGQINIANSAYLDGIMYGGSINFGNGARLDGSLMAGSYGAQNVLQNNARVYYRNITDYFPSYFPTVPPPGIAGAYSQVSGSWKEIK